MEWIERFNAALEYIEDNLAGDIDYERTARLACCSAYHFQRLFSYMADVPLAEYIRRRRLTLAAFDLQADREARVLDIALRYGYDSPTAFTRAFKAVHGIAPAAARERGVPLKAYPRLRFQITVKGVTEMEYRLVEKDAMRIIGVREHYDVSLEEGFRQVPQFWMKTGQSGVIPRLCTLMNQEPFGVLGVSAGAGGRAFDYYIGVSSDKEAPGDFEVCRIPAGTWAVFESVGPMPDAIQSLQKRIVTEWLPTSGYEYADAPDIEVYGPGDQQAADYRCEVWLPVVKKENRG